MIKNLTFILFHFVKNIILEIKSQARESQLLTLLICNFQEFLKRSQQEEQKLNRNYSSKTQKHVDKMLE